MFLQTFFYFLNVLLNILFKRCLVLLKPFPQSFITQIDNLIRYIYCSLIKFNSNIKDLSLISSTLTSSLPNIQSLTSLVDELPESIKKVLSNLQTAIGLNITLLCVHINNIDKSIKCCQNTLRGAGNIICTINNLIDTKCNKGIIDCFKKCLKEIKCKLIQLQTDLCNLYHSYSHINCLIIETQNIIRCNNDILNLNSKTCRLIEEFKCSISEFDKIESCIKCIKSKIAEIKEIVESIRYEGQTLTFKIKTRNQLTAYIANINGSNGKEDQIKCLIEKLKCLGQNIDKICSEFKKIESNTTDLKHSLVFNHYYFQISSYILEHLHCIETQQTTLSDKLSTLKEVQSGIGVITDNISHVKFVIKKMNERRYDLVYVRESLCSIIPKVCEIKDSAKAITTKINDFECVLEPLNKIKSSIENLKKLEHDNICLQIFECDEKKTLKESWICMRNKLNINSITGKLDIINKYLCIFEGILFIENSFETLSFT